MSQKTASDGFAPKREMQAPRLRTVAVVAFDGVVLGDLTIPLELFGRVRDANGRRAYDVRVCSHARRVATSHFTMEVPCRLAWMARAETIIVPGVDDLTRAIPGGVIRNLRAAIGRGARVASICTGAFVLAATGALDGRRATTHWRAAEALARMHAKISVDPQVLYVDEGKVLTSAGAAAGFDLCMHMIRRDLGAEAAARVAKEAVLPLERAGGQAQFIDHALPSGNGSAIATLICWLDANLNRELKVPLIAKQAGMSSRTLSRRFHEQVGMSPAQWIAHARVRRAQRLLETTDLPIEQVADEVGLQAPSVLRERFREIVGVSPQAYRRAFRAA